MKRVKAVLIVLVAMALGVLSVYTCRRCAVNGVTVDPHT